jgi:hypothetical protein
VRKNCPSNLLYFWLMSRIWYRWYVSARSVGETRFQGQIP